MQVFVEKPKLVLPKSHGRTVGLHVSEVIRDLAFKSNTLDKKWQTEVAIELQDTNLMQVGMAWEDYLEKSKQHEEIEYHPGEVTVATSLCALCGDDSTQHALKGSDHEFLRLVIYMSPDGFTWDEDKCLLLFLNEIKFTKKSCRDFDKGLRMGSKKSLMYVWQIAAYLKAVKHLWSRLHVLFINGNYSYDLADPQSGSVYIVYRIGFTQDEVDANWRMLVNHAQSMVRNGTYKHEAPAKDTRRSVGSKAPKGSSELRR